MVEQGRERYLEIRRNKDGSERYIWHRKGFAARALPEDRNAAILEARRLNNQADRGILRPLTASPDSIEERLAWYCDHFERADRFKAYAKQTQANYRVQLRLIVETFPTQKITAFRKRDIKRFLETIESLGSRRITKSVLRAVFELALDDELIDRNPVDNISLPGISVRTQLWNDDMIARFIDRCDILDAVVPGHYEKTGRAEAMRRAFRLLEYTGQRPSDVLKMRWSHDDGEFMRVRQLKTDKLVDIYRGDLGIMIDEWHASLPAALASDDAPFATIVHSPDGRPYTMKWFNPMFRRVADAAGLGDLQARDLRRTAVTRLYEAGCSEGLVSAITGHDIETCRRILERYYVRTREASKQAITRLDEYRRRRAAQAAGE
jgi:integrase